jgi:hypothetical protein
MARVKSEKQLLLEWQEIKKNWYKIYQWTSLSTGRYAEIIAGLILESINEIRLESSNLRQSGFRLDSHRGQAELKSPITQFTEKRFCRAMFNAHNVPLLGSIRDYEVPLRAIDTADHGDIDLISQNENGLLLIESKQPRSKESILKAILQVFTYSMLVSSVRQPFESEFGVINKTRLIPVILTFDAATSGKQLRQFDQIPTTIALLEQLNCLLSLKTIEPMEFYVITDNEGELSRCLTSRISSRGEVFVEFKNSYLPKIKQLEI